MGEPVGWRPMSRPQAPRESLMTLALVLPSASRGSYWGPVLAALACRARAVTVFTADPGPLEGTIGGAELRVVGRPRRIGPPAEATSEGYGRPGVTLLSPGLVLELRRLRPDVVFTVAFSLWTGLVIALKPLTGWRVVILYDGSSPEVDLRDARLRSLVRRAFARGADALLTNSRAGAEYLTTHLRAHGKVRVRPFMVPDPATLCVPHEAAAGTPAPGDERRLLFVGALERRKGLHHVLEALPDVVRGTDQPFRLVVAGDGPERDALTAQAARLGLADCVTWLGWLPYAELGGHLRTADAFVFPTLADTWGVALLEAMAHGKPVVTSCFAGAAELVDDGESGYVIDPRDVGLLARRLREIVNDPDRAAAMGTAAAAALRSHHPEAVADALLELAAEVRA